MWINDEFQIVHFDTPVIQNGQLSIKKPAIFRIAGWILIGFRAD